MRSPAEALTALDAVVDDLVGVDPAGLAGGEAVELLHRELERLGGDDPGGGRLRRRPGPGRPTGPGRPRRGWPDAVACQAAAPPPGAPRPGAAATCRWWRRRGWPVTWARPRWPCSPRPARRRRPSASPVTRRCWWAHARDLGHRPVVRVLGLLVPAGRSRRHRGSAERQHAVVASTCPRASGARGSSTASRPRSTAGSVAEALRRIEDELFEADWAEAKAAMGDGDGPRLSDLGRTRPNAGPTPSSRWPAGPWRPRRGAPKSRTDGQPSLADQDVAWHEVGVDPDRRARPLRRPQRGIHASGRRLRYRPSPSGPQARHWCPRPALPAARRGRQLAHPPGRPAAAPR